MKASADLIKALGVTLELTNTQLSDPAVKVMLADLSSYPEAQVTAALKRCCRELKGRLTLADILSRLDDGRPGPEEAWAMVPRDERVSAFWTPEMREAWSTAYPLIEEGAEVPARMAFLERYRVLVQEARNARVPVTWEFTPGTDKSGRELVVLDAARKGRISIEAAKGLLPYHREDPGVNARLLALAGETVKALAAPGDEGKLVREALRNKYLPTPRAA